MAQAQREWFEKDYYKVLGIPTSATEAEIRRVYRKLAKEHHPDSSGGTNGKVGDDRFKEISAAYDVLSDPEKRKQYDEVRRAGAAGAGFGPRGPGPGGAGAGAGGTTFGPDDLGDFSDLLGGLFTRYRGGADPAGSTRRSTAGPQRGAAVEAALHLSFTDAVNGITTTVNLTSEAACSVCHGTGAAPGTAPVSCPDCGGRGVLEENQGYFSFSRACPRCSGRGFVVEKPCPTCGGRGIEIRPRKVKVRIPAGVQDGQRIRVKGRGAAGRNGGPPGDLYVVVSVAGHPLFGRKGRDLTVTVPVTFAEAALGSDLTVPTLDSPVVLKLPPGTPTGRTFRVKSRGVPEAKGIGDLLVTVEVDVPTTLNPAQREAVEALAAATQTSPRAHLDAGAPGTTPGDS